jgi:hypothetical protein
VTLENIVLVVIPENMALEVITNKKPLKEHLKIPTKTENLKTKKHFIYQKPFLQNPFLQKQALPRTTSGRRVRRPESPAKPVTIHVKRRLVLMLQRFARAAVVPSLIVSTRYLVSLVRH